MHHDLQARSGSLAGCGAVILGGTAGVGLRTACRFAELGVRGLVLVGRDRARGDAACTTVRQASGGRSPLFVAADVSRPPGAQAAAAAALGALDAVEILVNTAGPSRPPRLLHTIPIDDLGPSLDEIILPPLLMMHALLPHMRERGRGTIVNVASDAAKVATPGETLVGAAMAAIVMFSRTAAMECKREGVRINVVTPSLVAGTPGAELIAGDPFSARLFEKAAAMASLGVADGDDVADAIAFLAGPQSRRITGQVLSVNGGISAA